MPLSTDITLPRDVTPAFPQHCVGCLGEASGHMQFRGSRSSLAGLAFFWTRILSRRVRCEVPTCDRCRAGMRRRRWLELSVLLGVAAPVVAVGLPLLKQYDLGRQWDKLIIVAVGCVAVAPYFVWSVLRPPAFDMTVRRDVVEYEFANEHYAALFELANEGHPDAEIVREPEDDPAGAP